MAAGSGAFDPAYWGHSHRPGRNGQGRLAGSVGPVDTGLGGIDRSVRHYPSETDETQQPADQPPTRGWAKQQGAVYVNLQVLDFLVALVGHRQDLVRPEARQRVQMREELDQLPQPGSQSG